MTSIKAVIFDMDGVLIDAKEWHYESLNRALATYGFTINRSEHLAVYDGLPTSKKLELLSRERGFPRALHKIVNELKQRYTLELIESQCRPRLEHVYALARLRREGYTLAVASNSIRQTVDLMMDKANLSGYFDFMLSNQDVLKPKPHPEIYLAAIAKAGASPQECVVVEDSHHGIEAATQAGANVLRVESVEEVTYSRIKSFIRTVEQDAEFELARRRSRVA